MEVVAAMKTRRLSFAVWLLVLLASLPGAAALSAVQNRTLPDGAADQSLSIEEVSANRTAFAGKRVTFRNVAMSGNLNLQSGCKPSYRFTVISTNKKRFNTSLNGDLVFAVSDEMATKAAQRGLHADLYYLVNLTGVVGRMQMHNWQTSDFQWDWTVFVTAIEFLTEDGTVAGRLEARPCASRCGMARSGNVGSRATSLARSARATQQHALVIDALPWAEITAIVDPHEHAVPIPNHSVTPAFIAVDQSGHYTITLRNGASRTIVATVGAAATVTRITPVDFGRVEAATFIESLNKYGVSRIRTHDSGFDFSSSSGPMGDLMWDKVEEQVEECAATNPGRWASDDRRVLVDSVLKERSQIATGDFDSLVDFDPQLRRATAAAQEQVLATVALFCEGAEARRLRRQGALALAGLEQIRNLLNQIVQRFTRELENGASQYFSGQYTAAQAAFAQLQYPGSRFRFQLSLFRAATAYALYLTDGSRDSSLREVATNLIRFCKNEDPSFLPDRKSFSPRFNELFATVR